jgi:2-polyprenyl-3-methyl-5-hydroxy-6-metoxy-1,4-benzoquinol methylase
VLEHLFEPEEVLKKYMKYLKKDGGIIASIPNIKNYTILSDLVIRDRFEYRDAGILDRSHLRFFTKKEIINMFERAGMHIIEMRSNLGFPMNIMDKMLNALISRHKIPGYSFFTIQYFVHAKKISN